MLSKFSSRTPTKSVPEQPTQLIDNRSDVEPIQENSEQSEIRVNSEMKVQGPMHNKFDPYMKYVHDQQERFRIAQEREYYRRRLQPNLWERVIDVFKSFNPFN